MASNLQQGGPTWTPSPSSSATASPTVNATTTTTTTTYQSAGSPLPGQPKETVIAVTPDGSSTSSPASPTTLRQREEDKDEAAFVDEFGFELTDECKITEEATYVKTLDGKMVMRREIKWARMASDWQRTNEKMFTKLKERCRKGIPAKLRGIAWQLLSNSRYEMESKANQGVYALLKAKKLDEEIEGMIERDLNRTFPTHVLFRDIDGLGQTTLRSVLHAYACIDPEVGYVQGMGFIVGTLLTQMSEEEAFWSLHQLMHEERYRLREMYRPGFPMLHLFFYQLKRLLQVYAPKLATHFDEQNVDPAFYAAQWFLTLFVYHFTFRALLRVWDVFLCEGWKIVFRVAICLLKWEESTLLKMQFDTLVPYIKNLHEGKNPDEILLRALKIKFKTAELLKFREEFEAEKAAQQMPPKK